MSTESQIDALHRARVDSWGKVNMYRLRTVLQHAGPSILDMGCSTGAYVAYLNENGYETYGLDLLADAAWIHGKV